MSHDAIPSFSAMLRAALGDALAPNAATFLDMFDERGIMEFPFAPPGMTGRLEGRVALAEHLESLVSLIAIDDFKSPTVHRSRDDVFVLEFEGRGRGIATARPYLQTYVSVIKIEGGRITHYRDYWNPLVVLETMAGSAPQDAVSGGEHAS